MPFFLPFPLSSPLTKETSVLPLSSPQHITPIPRPAPVLSFSGHFSFFSHALCRKLLRPLPDFTPGSTTACVSRQSIRERRLRHLGDLWREKVFLALLRLHSVASSRTATRTPATVLLSGMRELPLSERSSLAVSCNQLFSHCQGSDYI